MRRALFIIICFVVQTLQSYEFSKLTVLTGPVGKEHSNKISGHYAVTRSLLRGLGECGVSHNYNPSSIDNIGDIVLVIAGSDEVIDQILDLKKKGKVKRIIVGPNNAALVSNKYPYIGDRNISRRLLLSEWVIHAHMLRTPGLSQEYFVPWYSGVDETYFSPTGMNNYSNKTVLVYNKFQNNLTKQVTRLLSKRGWKPVVIRYGKYKIDEYREILGNVAFSVFLSASESQGIALAESWAMDVPTLCWNPKNSVDYLGVHYPYTSSCPYLNSELGVDWESLQELDSLLDTINALLPNFHPRSWVLENMTDKKSVEYLLRIIQEME